MDSDLSSSLCNQTVFSAGRFLYLQSSVAQTNQRFPVSPPRGASFWFSSTSKQSCSISGQFLKNQMQSSEYFFNVCVLRQIFFFFFFSKLSLLVKVFFFWRTLKQYLPAVVNRYMCVCQCVCVCVCVCVYRTLWIALINILKEHVYINPPHVSYKVIRLRFIAMWMW